MYHPGDEDLDLRGVLDPDFLALGLGGTNMMSMLWAVALGRRTVGVEMRGDPFLGVHWNIREDLYHQLGLIDQMMLDRYGREGVPCRAEGSLFSLAECFYSMNTTAGDIVADEIIDGFDRKQHIVGTIHHVEFIDDRWREGIPHRVVTILSPPKPPQRPDSTRIRTDMVDVLDGPSTFQAGASSILVLLRRYLERIEKMDLESGREPRVRLFCRHRVVPTDGDGFIRESDGRLRIRIEALQELDYKGRFVRLRMPGSQVIDLGVPELFVIAQGFHSSDADRLGFEQQDVAVDHQDGRGPLVAQADFIAGLIEVLVGGRLRRRISSVHDENGNEFWVRQIAVGHEDDPEVGWVLVQVPDFLVFDPVQAGLVASDTDPESPEFYAAYQQLVYDFYLQQCAEVLELPKSQLKKVQMVYGPKLFSLVERVGTDARVAPNGVIAGDSFGNGHFLTSGGAMTGMIGHAARVLQYWQARNAGVTPREAIRTLAVQIEKDTHAWLQVSAKEYGDAIPINFGAERIAQIASAGGFLTNANAASIDAKRRQRHSLLPLDPSDWRRLFLRNGRVHSAPLPELHAMHPVLRGQRVRRGRSKMAVAYVARTLDLKALHFLRAVLGQPGIRLGLVTQDAPDALSQSLRDRIGSVAHVRTVADPQAVADAVRNMSDALGTVERIVGPLEFLQVPLAEVRAALGIGGMTVEVAQNFHDKGRMRERLRAAGLPVTRHCLVGDWESARAFAQQVRYPVIIKPSNPSSAESIFRANDEQALQQRLDFLGPGPWLCEEHVDGQACTFEVVSIGGVPAWSSATRFDRAPPHLLELPTTEWTVLLPREGDDPADPVTRRMGFAVLRTLGMGSGISHMQWWRRNDGSAVISDVSARPPDTEILSLMGAAHGADLYRAWANATLHEQFAPIPRLFAAGAAFFRGCGNGSRVVAIRGWEELQRELNPWVVSAALPRVGDEAHRSDGCVIVRHEDTATVQHALMQLRTRVRVELG